MAVGPETVGADQEDNTDSLSLYQTLENEVIPLYYQRDREGIPHEWIKMMKESIRTITPAFSARRMVKDYVEKMYINTANHALFVPIKRQNGSA